MKIQQTQTLILRKYMLISNLMKMEASKKESNNVYLWGVNLIKDEKIKGHINQMGNIDIGKNRKIKINKENNLELIKKPFFSSWAHTLKKINQALDDVIVNFNDPKTVETCHLKIGVWSKKIIEKIQNAQKNIQA